MKTHRLSLLCVLLAAALAVTACREEPNTTTMRLRLSPGTQTEASSRDAIKPVGEGLDIVSYAIHGTGPNGNTFSITTNSSQVDISGLVIGTWTLDVTGMNRQGTALATGVKTHHLTTKANVVEIAVDTLVGSGTLSVGFSWGEPSFTNIAFDLRLKPQNGTEEQVTSGVSVNASLATALFETTLAAGSYSLAYALYSEGVKIAGGMETIRVVDGALTQGEVPIIVDKETPEATGLTIASRIAAPVEGTITGIDSAVLPNTPLTASFIHESGGGGSSINVTWYLDGESIASGDSVQFSTYTGPHRLDAVASTDMTGSVGSASWPFRATVASLDGIPVVVSTIAGGESDMYAQPYRLDQVTDAAFLRDGRLLTASSSGMQLCEVARDRLVVVRNFTSLGPGTPVQNDTYPVNGVTDIEIDTVDNIVCTTAGDLGIVVLYQYISGTGDLQKIAAFEPSTANWHLAITNAVLDRDNNTVFTVDTSTHNLHAISYGSGAAVEHDAYILAQFDAQITNPAKITISSDGLRLGVVCPTNRTFHSYTVGYDVSGIPTIGYESNNILDESMADGPFGMEIVGETAQVMLADGLHIFRREENVWPWGYIGKMAGIDTPVADMAFDSLYGRAWAVGTGTEPKVISLSLYGGTPVLEGEMPCGPFAGSKISFSPLGNLLSLLGNDSLMLLRISDG